MPDLRQRGRKPGFLSSCCEGSLVSNRIVSYIGRVSINLQNDFLRRMFMNAHFTSIVLENGTLPIAASIQKRLMLNPGDQVRIQLTVLKNPAPSRKTASRYDELLWEKDVRVLTLQEQAELIALANAEFDAAITNTKQLVQKEYPELFDEQGNLKKKKAAASLRPFKRKPKSVSRPRRAQR